MSFLSRSASVWSPANRSLDAEQIYREVERTERRKCVTNILESGRFRNQLEGVIEGILDGSHAQVRRNALRKLQDNVYPAAQLQNSVGGMDTNAHRFKTFSNIRPIDDLRGNVHSYSRQECTLRRKLAALYRLVDWLGWSQAIYNHITVRIRRSHDEFLLNPFGLLYEEISASSLVKVDDDGQILDEGSTAFGISKAGYTLHSAIHAARPEIQCVIHVHTTAGAAVSAMKCGLLPICQEALILGEVSYHDYSGILVDLNERERIARDLGPSSKVLILRNHGLVALGETIEEAFHYLFNLVKACQTQVAAMSAGLGPSQLLVPSRDVQRQVWRTVTRGGGGVSSGHWGVGELEFEAYMRMLDNMGHNTGLVHRTSPMIRNASSLQSTKGKTADSLLTATLSQNRRRDSKDDGDELVGDAGSQTKSSPQRKAEMWSFLDEPSPTDADQKMDLSSRSTKRLKLEQQEKATSAKQTRPHTPGYSTTPVHVSAQSLSSKGVRDVIWPEIDSLPEKPFLTVCRDTSTPLRQGSSQSSFLSAAGLENNTSNEENRFLDSARSRSFLEQASAVSQSTGQAVTHLADILEKSRASGEVSAAHGLTSPRVPMHPTQRTIQSNPGEDVEDVAAHVAMLTSNAVDRLSSLPPRTKEEPSSTGRHLLAYGEGRRHVGMRPDSLQQTAAAVAESTGSALVRASSAAPPSFHHAGHAALEVAHSISDGVETLHKAVSSSGINPTRVNGLVGATDSTGRMLTRLRQSPTPTYRLDFSNMG